MWLSDLFFYHGPIPQSIKHRAISLASQTNTYIAFDRDGTCYMYPVKPIRLDQSGVWKPVGRTGMFQREEIRFTTHKYRYSNWQELICPTTVNTTFTHQTYDVTRKLHKKGSV